MGLEIHYKPYVLVVDDEKPIRDTLINIVSLTSKIAIGCGNYQEAWRQFLHHYPDLHAVSCDGCLQGHFDFTGINLLIAMRDYERQVLHQAPEQLLRMLMVSGSDLSEEQTGRLILQRVTILPKPVDIDDYLSKLGLA